MSENVVEVSDTSPPKRDVSILEIFLTFLIIGGTSFGGGVVAYLRNSLVSTKEWLNEDEFLTVLEISQTLPGLNATNMAVLVGDRLRGIPGAIAGFVGMTLPGSIMVFVLGLVYASNSHNPTINAVLKGIGAASVGLLLAVTLKIGHKQLEHYLDIILVSVTLILVSFMHVSLILVLLTVGPIAVFLYRPRNLSRDKSGTDKKAAD
ncbi:MAG: chromate transporter [Chthoniobacterales bacterium]